jgi:hypothetical protein
MRLATHPPYSTDFAPSDSFLFGHVKYCLQGIMSPSQEKLLAAIGEIVAAIPIKIMHGVFGWRSPNGFNLETA